MSNNQSLCASNNQDISNPSCIRLNWSKRAGGGGQSVGYVLMRVGVALDQPRSPLTVPSGLKNTHTRTTRLSADEEVADTPRGPRRQSALSDGSGLQ